MSMNREELKKFINELLKKERLDHISLIITKKFPKEKEMIIELTNYLINPTLMERIYQIINDIYEIKKCRFCNINSVNFINYSNGYKKFCSVKCSNRSPETQIKKEQKKIDNFGDKNYNNMEKNKQTKKEKYGNENYNNFNKIKQTKKEKYGNENYNNRDQCKITLKNNPEIVIKSHEKRLKTLEDDPKITIKSKEKMKKTLEDNPIITENRVKNLKNSLFNKEFEKLFNSERFKNLLEPLFDIKSYRGNKNKKNNKIYINIYKWKCKKCNNEFESGVYNGKIPRCPICFPIENRFSVPHKKISEFLRNININYIIEKYIDPYHVDIFIEPNKIVEIYGDFWHCNPIIYESTFYNEGSNKTAQEIWEYDKKREEYLKSNNYEVLILWEREINENFEKIKEKIKNYLTK